MPCPPVFNHNRAINLKRNTAERWVIPAVTPLLVVRFIERFRRQPHGDLESGSKGFAFGDAVQLDFCGAELFKQFFLLTRKDVEQFSFIFGVAYVVVHGIPDYLKSGYPAD